MFEEIYTIQDEQLEPLIQSEEDDELMKDDPVEAWIMFLFAIVGAGTSWVLINTIWIELPWFQQDEPEGMLLANEMTVSLAMAGIPIIPIFIGIDRGWNINYRVMVYILIALQTITCMLMAGFWSASVNGISTMILIGTFVGAFCAGVQGITIYAYFVSINNRLSAPMYLGANTG